MEKHRDPDKKRGRKKETAARRHPEEMREGGITEWDGGVTLSTAEILDFSEGTDSTP